MKTRPQPKVLHVGFPAKGISDTRVHLPNTLGIDTEGVFPSALGTVDRHWLFSQLTAYTLGGPVEDIITWKSVETGVTRVYIAANGGFHSIHGATIASIIATGRSQSKSRPDKFFNAGPNLFMGNGIDETVFYSPIGGLAENKILPPLIISATPIYCPDSSLANGDTYAYKVRYVDAYGNRGPFSPPSYVVIPSHIVGAELWRVALKLSEPQSVSENYDRLEIYRTQKVTNGVDPVFYKLDEISSLQTSYVDFLGDAGLALNEPENTNRNTSPNFGSAEEFLGRLFVGNNIDEPRVVRYTEQNRFFEFPPENLFEFPQPVVGFAKLYDKLAVFCSDSIYLVIGDSAGNLQAVPAISDVGLDHKNLVQVVNGKAYFVYNKRIYMFDGFKTENKTRHLEIWGDRALGLTPQPATSVSKDDMAYFSAAYDSSLTNAIVIFDTRSDAVFYTKPIVKPKAGSPERINALARYHDMILAGTDQGHIFMTGSDLGDETTPYVYESPFMYGDDIHSKKALQAIYIIYSAVTSEDLQLEIFVNGYEGKAVETQTINLVAHDDCDAHLNGWDEKNWGEETWVENPTQVMKLCYATDINFESIKLKISKTANGYGFASIVDVFVEYLDQGTRGLAEC